MRARVVGQVGDDAARGLAQRRRIDRERVAFENLQLAGIGGGDLREGGQGARIALDGDDARGAFHQQRAGQPAGTGAHFDRRARGEVAAVARNPPRQVQIE